MAKNTGSTDPIDLSQCATPLLNSNLQVYILCNDVNKLNPDYVRMFSQAKSGFSRPIFSGTQFPDTPWINYFTGFMNRNQAIELYNHYQIWLLSMEKAQPFVIIYDRSYPTQPDNVMLQLIKAGQFIHNQDILFYGKYMDRCDLYQYSRTVIIDGGFKFPLYHTVSSYGIYAYMIYPSGAQKLIDEMSYNPAPTEILVNRLIEKSILSAITYHPSIIRLDDPNNITVRYECRNSVKQKYILTWESVFISILLGLAIGILIYFIVTNITYRGVTKSQSVIQVPTQVQPSAPNPEVRVGSIRSPIV